MKASEQVKSPQVGITYEKLKTMKGFEDITEAEAEKEIAIIKRLAKIMYLFMQEQNQGIENTNSKDNENNNR